MQVIAAFQKKKHLNYSFVWISDELQRIATAARGIGWLPDTFKRGYALNHKGGGGEGGREHVGVIVSKIATSAAVQRLKLNTFNFPHPLTIISTQWSSVVVPLSALMHDISSVGQLNI